ncbi:QWRF motif-containing protein 3 [Linum perenne]
MNDPSQKPRRSTKSREVSSRFLLAPASSPSREFIICNTKNGTNPSSSSSPVSQSPVRSIKSAARVKSRNPEPSLWPSSAAAKTLADHLGSNSINKRLKDAQLSKCDSERMIQIQKEKENHRPAIGGSFRYSGKQGFRGNNKPSSPSSSESTSSSSSGTLYTNSGYVPGRLSVDENALYKTSTPAASVVAGRDDGGNSSRRQSEKFPGDGGGNPSRRQSEQFPGDDGGNSSRRKSEQFPDEVDPELCEWAENCAEFDCFDGKEKEKPSRRKLGLEIPSKYLTTIHRASDPKPRPDSLDRSSSLEVSPKKKKKFNIKGAIKRANSLTGAATPSQWALSPGRTGSPPMTVENKERPMSFSTWKPSSSSTHRGMEKLLSLGFDLFKSSKRISYAPSSASSLSSSSSSKSLGGNSDNVHQLRMIHCRMLQWRYANARAESVNQRMNKQAESDMVSAWNTILRMRQSVARRKLQLQKEQLEMKLAFILHSQIRGLETWEGMEQKHASALSATQESLQAVVCRVPLVNGARVNQELASLAFRHATDLTESITSTLTAFSPPADETVELLSELAEVVAREKLLIEEFHEIYQTVSTLQVEENDLKSAVIQLNDLHKQQQEQSC